MDRTAQLIELMNDEDAVYAYVYQDNRRTEYVFHGSSENIASFIGSHAMADEIIITDIWDCHILNTFGPFIDRCANPMLLKQVKEALIPIQMGVSQPHDVFSPMMEEVEKLYADQSSVTNINLGGI